MIATGSPRLAVQIYSDNFSLFSTSGKYGLTPDQQAQCPHCGTLRESFGEHVRIQTDC